MSNPFAFLEGSRQSGCVGQVDQNTPYYYTNETNPGCCSGVPWVFGIVKYCSLLRSCTACPSNALTTEINDDITCINNVCPTGWLYLDTFYGCVKKLPNGNGCASDGIRNGCSRKSTDNTLNSIVDRWLDMAKRPTVEGIYGPIEDWDVSLVKNFRDMFHTKTTFNADISKWNVAAAETMFGMFYRASVFNSDVSMWQTGKVTDMLSMFDQASAFNSDLSKWQTNKVINMHGIFHNSGFTRTLCGGAWESLTGSNNAFNVLGYSPARYGCCPIGSFMSNPFIVAPFSEVNSCTGCPSNALTTVVNDDITCYNNGCPTGTWYLNTFYGCVKKLPNGNDGYDAAGRTGDTLNRIVDDWLDTAKIYAVEAIYGPIGDWDVSAVTNFNYLFYQKTTFNADISKWNVTAVEKTGWSEWRYTCIGHNSCSVVLFFFSSSFGVLSHNFFPFPFCPVFFLLSTFFYM